MDIFEHIRRQAAETDGPAEILALVFGHGVEAIAKAGFLRITGAIGFGTEWPPYRAKRAARQTTSWARS